MCVGQVLYLEMSQAAREQSKGDRPKFDREVIAAAALNSTGIDSLRAKICDTVVTGKENGPFAVTFPIGAKLPSVLPMTAIAIEGKKRDGSLAPYLFNSQWSDDALSRRVGQKKTATRVTSAWLNVSVPSAATANEHSALVNAIRDALSSDYGIAIARIKMCRTKKVGAGTANFHVDFTGPTTLTKVNWKQLQAGFAVQTPLGMFIAHLAGYAHEIFESQNICPWCFNPYADAGARTCFCKRAKAPKAPRPGGAQRQAHLRELFARQDVVQATYDATVANEVAEEEEGA